MKNPIANLPLADDASRRSFLKLSGVLGAAAAISASVAACSPVSQTSSSGSTGSASADPTKELVAGISFALSSGFDPGTASGATPVAANNHIFEGLVDLHPATRKPYLALAASDPKKVSDTSWEVELKQGATFHDGSPVTVDDVVWSFKRILDPALKSLFAGFLPFLKDVAKKDDKTVAFTLKTPFAEFAQRIAVVKVVPKALTDTAAKAKAFDAKPVGSGPYKFVSAAANDKIVFAKFDGYKGQYPARANSMTWLLISDGTARVNSIPSRTQAIEDVPYLDIDSLKSRATVQAVQSFGQLFLMFNCAKAPFSDKRVRQALHYALDTDSIIKKALLGNAKAATSYFQEGHPDYTKASTQYTYDPGKAKQLLQEAGVSDLSLRVTSTQNSWIDPIMPLVKENWDAVGVKTTLDIAPTATVYSAQRADGGDYDVVCASGDPSVFGNDGDLLLSWFYRPGTWMKTRARWAGAPEFAQIQTLLDQAAQSDAAKAKGLHAQVVDIIAEQAPLYSVFHRQLPTAWDEKQLLDFQPLPTTGVSFIGVGHK
ncbi:ABC transporter substrate-binding protein [Sinomonas soli]